jgi:alpha-glucosidase
MTGGRSSMKVSNKIEKIDNRGEHIDITTDGGKFRIIFLKSDILRIRCTFQDEFSEESSYALVMTAWEDKMDSILGEERKRIKPYIAEFEEFEKYIGLNTDKLKVKINKEPFGIDIYDNEGNLLHSDLKEKSYVKDEQGRVYHYSCMNDDNSFYGFGEKAGYINKVKTRMRMNNVDTLGYDSEKTDPLYKHIPFYIKLDRTNNIACGLFYSNSYESVFDMGCERSGYWNKYSYFSADGGDIDLFFIKGPEIKTVVKNYTDLTGKTALPPLYTLGYFGSTMFYTELEKDSDEAVLGFIDKTKEEGIPCDGFFLSSGYTTGSDGKRYVFNWNNERFSNPEKFISNMKEKGGDVSPNVKPGMLVTNPLYNEFKEANAYIRDHEDKEPHKDRYWGGKASFVDFTNPKGRELWKKHLKESLVSKGISCIWNDNCEYEINDPKAICDLEGDKISVKAVRPILPNLMAMVAQEAVKETFPDVRPYITNRAGFAGIQRYAQTWAGDNSTSWHSLKFNIPVILGMGLSGVANQGCDIGGFYGPAPEPELFVRWVQNGIFQPRFSIHSCNTDNTVTEPWMYPSYTRCIKDAIKFRYSMAPYLYSLLHEAATEGSPIMRPMFYEFQRDLNTYEESFDFMYGKSMLVASIYEKGSTSRSVYLPEGCIWYDWYTKEMYKGGQTIEVKTSLDKIPLFFRSGSIIPMAEEIMNLHSEKIETLNILIEPWESSEFTLYEDDGISNNYLKGEYLKTHIKVNNAKNIKINFNKEGSYDTKVKNLCLNIICRELAPINVSLGDKTIKFHLDKKQWESSEEGWYYDNEEKTAKIKYENPVGDYTVSVNFDVKDLISI